MTVPINSTRELENALKQIITAGWAMKSDGDVEAPTGYFAKIPIAANELSELLDAVFGATNPPEAQIEPGCYVTKEDSAGNMWVWKYDNKYMMDVMYARFEREYAEWGKPTYYIVCRNCSHTFDDIQEAFEHGATDPNTKSWCGDDGFDVTEGGVL